MIEKYWQKLREHSWFTIAGLSCLFFVYVLISHIIPLCGEVLDIHKTIEKNRQKIDQVKDWQTMYDQLEGRKKHLKKQIEQFVFSQKQDTHLSRILTFLSKSAKETGVRIQTIKPQEIKKAKTHIELPIQLTLTTRFHQLAHFVNTIETSEPVIKLESVKITAKKMISNLLHVEMTLAVYYLI